MEQDFLLVRNNKEVLDSLDRVNYTTIKLWFKCNYILLKVWLENLDNLSWFSEFNK